MDIKNADSVDSAPRQEISRFLDFSHSASRIQVKDVDEHVGMIQTMFEAAITDHLKRFCARPGGEV